MDYASAFDIIAKYAPDALQYFGDRFERWPDEQTAAKIIPILQKAIRFHRSTGPLIAEYLALVNKQIEERCLWGGPQNGKGGE